VKNVYLLLLLLRRKRRRHRHLCTQKKTRRERAKSRDSTSSAMSACDDACAQRVSGHVPAPNLHASLNWPSSGSSRLHCSHLGLPLGPMRLSLVILCGKPLICTEHSKQTAAAKAAAAAAAAAAAGAGATTESERTRRRLEVLVRTADRDLRILGLRYATRSAHVFPDLRQREEEWRERRRGEKRRRGEERREERGESRGEIQRCESRARGERSRRDREENRAARRKREGRRERCACACANEQQRLQGSHTCTRRLNTWMDNTSNLINASISGNNMQNTSE
jgi:hypothetical protein